MNVIIIAAATFCISVLTTIAPATGQERGTQTDPNKARLIISDIELFWNAYDAAEKVPVGERAAVYQDAYLAKGTAGLKEFDRERIGGGKALAIAVEKRPGYYREIRAATGRVGEFAKPIREGFLKAKDLYPKAVFPDVYFVIGSMTSAGMPGNRGLLMGTEMLARTPQVPEKELSPRLKLTLMPIEELPLVVIHELWHVQQNYPKEDETLLAGAINEGCCDFLTELVTGKTANEGLRKYGDDHEKQLWTEFRRDMMLGDKMDDWLYQGDEAKYHPADMGYYVGYRICKAYYEQASDKKAAVEEMLTIQDFPAFLKASKYQGAK